MGLFDKVVRDQSHEISRYIAMQQTQFYFAKLGVGLALVLLAAAPVQAATMAQRPAPDPLLDGGPPSPCSAEIDYAAGSDVNGRYVPPADVAASKVPVPDAISVPLHAGRQAHRRGRTPGEVPYVSLDGRRLEPLVNPEPCQPPPRR